MDSRALVTYEANVVRSKGCWGWKGSFHSAGYGQIPKWRRVFLAHRVSFEIANGPIPAGMDVMHICHNPQCTNPDHLALGSRKENMQTSQKAGRLQRKIPLEHMPSIIDERRAGVTLQTIAARYGCSKQAVRHMLMVADRG